MYSNEPEPSPKSSKADTKDKHPTITARQKIPRPRRLVFTSKAKCQAYILVYSERYSFVWIRNSGYKYYTTIGKLIKFAICYAKGNRKSKLVKYRTSAIAKVKKPSQKSDYRVRGTVSAINKDNPDGSQLFLLSTYTKYNYLSILLISLSYYCRQKRSNCFRNFLSSYKEKGALPQLIRALAKEEFITKPSLSQIEAVLVLRDIYNEFAKLRYKLIAQKTPVKRVLIELNN